MSSDSPLDAWLARATETLGQAGTARVRQEIGRHAAQRMMHEGLSIAEAVEALGDPATARRRFTKLYLTEAEEARLRFQWDDEPVAPIETPRWLNWAFVSLWATCMIAVLAIGFGGMHRNPIVIAVAIIAFSFAASLTTVMRYAWAGCFAQQGRRIYRRFYIWARRALGVHHIWFVPALTVIIPQLILYLIVVAGILLQYDKLGEDDAKITTLMEITYGGLILYTTVFIAIKFFPVSRYFVLFSKVRRLERTGN